MKVTNLIMPIVALSNLNTQQTAPQISREISVIYNYNEVVNPIQFPTADQCWETYQRALAVCALLGPFSAGCAAIATTAFTDCMASAT